jgi:hypothetical protein
MKESERMVELTGEAFDLDSLEWWSAKSNSPLYSIVKKHDKYWLKSPRFGRGTDPSSLRAAAKELIPIIKGTSKVRNLDVQSIDVGSGIQVGEAQHVVVEGPTANVKMMLWKEDDIIFMKTNGMIFEIGPKISPHFPYPQDRILELDVKIQRGLKLDSLLHALENCIDDEYVYATFSHFVEEPSWLSLSNTFEMIKFDVDKNLDHNFSTGKCTITANGWSKKQELESFTATANSHLAEAKPRHSFAYSLNEELKRKTKNPVKEQKHQERRKNYEENHPLMSLIDASALITRIFRGWCKWKALTC